MKTIALKTGLAVILSLFILNVSANTVKVNDEKDKEECTETNVEIVEQELEIEPWMLNMEEFNQIEETTESEMPIENWMLNIEEWESSEKEIKLESWMLQKIQSKNTVYHVIESEMEIEGWMLN